MEDGKEMTAAAVSVVAEVTDKECHDFPQVDSTNRSNIVILDKYDTELKWLLDTKFLSFSIIYV